MNPRRAAYWTATTLIAFAFVSGGAAYLLGAEVPVKGVAALGYPAHFIAFLGAWKLLGGLAILAPRLPRLKEWAYAGITFDLTGAAFAYVATGAPLSKTIAPLVLLGITGTSWALRPASRALAASAAAAGEPSSPGHVSPSRSVMTSRV